MDNEFIITEEDINEYMDCPGDLFSRSDEKLAFIQYEKGKFIMEYEKDNYDENGCLKEGREPALEQIPGFLKTLIGKDIRFQPITFGDLKELIKEMDDTVDDSAVVLMPGYEDNGYDRLHSLCVEKVLVNEYFEEEKKYDSARYYAESYQHYYEPISKIEFNNALILKSDKYLMRNEDVRNG